MNSRDLLRITSRTFAIGIERLPGVLCEATTVAYLLLRVSDYLEDNEEMKAEEKIVLLNRWVNVLREECTVDEIVARGFERATVGRVLDMVKRNEYKRRQAPPGVRVSRRAFGRDWRYPITNGYRR